MPSLRDLFSLSLARLNRLRRKPPAEIVIFLIKRSRQALLHSKDRIRMMFGEIKLEDDGFFRKLAFETSSLGDVKKDLEEKRVGKAKAELVLHMRTRTAPSFFFDRCENRVLMKALEKDFPGLRARTIESADSFVHHRFQLLGNRLHFEGNIDWHFSGFDKKTWPLSFSPNIDYFSSNRIGDIKIAWELNRTQHFVVLGKAYGYTGDEKYAREFSEEILSWIRDNPYKIGINWMEGIEVATRLFTWVCAYYLFLDSEYFNEKAHFEFLKSAYVQTKFIEQHLSDKWRINNNHLIAEAAGLVLMGIMFPEFEEARAWRKKGIEIIEGELNNQILSDGFTWEQSTGYQKFVADFVLYAVVLMSKNRMGISKKILGKLDQMIEFLNCIMKSNGYIPLIGDEDQGRVMKLDESNYEDITGTLAVGSILLNRKDWMRTKSEEAAWLFGPSALTGRPVDVAVRSRLFPDSGMMVMRDKDKYMLFIVGPQDSRYSHASHRHFDELSFVLDAYETAFLVDPGTYTYFGDFGWRKYFKSRKAHNTVVVDDSDPVDIKEVFESSRVPASKIQGCTISSGFDWISATFNGYKKVSHTRHVFFVRPEYWVVMDLIRGTGEHFYDLYFHYGQDVELKFNREDQSALAMNLDSRLRTIPLATSGLNGEILHGKVSPRYGEKLDADILRYRRIGRPPQSFVSVLIPYDNDETKKIIDVKVSPLDIYGKDNRPLNENEAIGIKIDFGDFEDYLVHSFGKERNLTFGNFRNREGKIIYIREAMKRVLRDFIL